MMSVCYYKLDNKECLSSIDHWTYNHEMSIRLRFMNGSIKRDRNPRHGGQTVLRPFVLFGNYPFKNTTCSLSTGLFLRASGGARPRVDGSSFVCGFSRRTAGTDSVVTMLLGVFLLKTPRQI